MTEQEKKDWKELCSYIKTKILRYDDHMKFPQLLALRLKGLSTGNYIANNYHQAQAKYDYKTILITAKLCRNRIIDYIDRNSTHINGEQHKINIILKIIESEINDVYIRLQNVKKQKEKIQTVEIPTNQSAEYNRKSKKHNSNLDELW